MLSLRGTSPSNFMSVVTCCVYLFLIVIICMSNFFVPVVVTVFLVIVFSPPLIFFCVCSGFVSEHRGANAPHFAEQILPLKQCSAVRVYAKFAFQGPPCSSGTIVFDATKPMRFAGGYTCSFQHRFSRTKGRRK